MMQANVYKLQEKYNTYMGIEERDKKRFESIISWSGNMVDLSIKERAVREFVKPQRGEIWTVDFGENVGTETNRTRPCLILQENTANDKAATIMGAPITTHQPRFFTHLSIHERDYESLHHNSECATGTVMLEQMRVLSKARLGRKIGKLSDHSMIKMDGGIKAALGVK